MNPAVAEGARRLTASGGTPTRPSRDASRLHPRVARAVHTLLAMPRFRMFAIACGYEDTDNCDKLHADPLFKLAVGRAPEGERDFSSQLATRRLGTAPSWVEID